MFLRAWRRRRRLQKAIDLVNTELRRMESADDAAIADAVSRGEVPYLPKDAGHRELAARVIKYADDELAIRADYYRVNIPPESWIQPDEDDHHEFRLLSDRARARLRRDIADAKWHYFVKRAEGLQTISTSLTALGAVWLALIAFAC